MARSKFQEAVLQGDEKTVWNPTEAALAKNVDPLTIVNKLYDTRHG